MARTLHRLSAKDVKNAKPGMHPDGGGLYLQATAGRDDHVRKSWIFRYVRQGDERQMGLGSIDVTTLAEARDRALECRRLLFDNIDPIGHRNAQRAAKAAESAKTVTFDACCDQYIQSNQAAWSSLKHKSQWESSLRIFASPILGKLPVQSIDTNLVLKVLEPIWTTKAVTARRVRGRLEMVLDFATSRKLRSGENPAAWKGNLDHILPNLKKVKQVKNHPALPYKQMPEFMAKLREHNDVAADALRFLVLCASRAGEVLKAEWKELDLDDKAWTVPAVRTKGRRDHKVALCGDAMDILTKMQAIRQGDRIFPGLSEHALRRALGRTGYSDQTDVHGLRASFKTWAGEETSFARELAEVALAHRVGDDTEQAYARGTLFERRRALMEAWSAYANQ